MEKQYYTPAQWAFKIAANAYQPFLPNKSFIFYDPDVAEKVTKTGKETLTKMLTLAE